MSEQITVEIFDHLVDLAALELSADQAEYLRRQLNNQLKAIHELETIPLDEDIPISLHGVPYEAAKAPLRAKTCGRSTPTRMPSWLALRRWKTATSSCQISPTPRSSRPYGTL